MPVVGGAEVKVVGRSGQISRIERGLAWAAKAAPAETDLSGLLKRRMKRRGYARGGRR
jgi:hypothetical protein